MAGNKYFNNGILYDESTTPTGITLNTTDYVTLLAPNKNRLGYKVSNNSNKDVLIKEKAFNDPDSLDRGFLLVKNSFYQSPGDRIYIGEVSAKAVTDSPVVLVTEE